MPMLAADEHVQKIIYEPDKKEKLGKTK